MLTKHKFAKPYDATFQAVTLARSDFNPTLKKSTDIVIVTTGVYHTLQTSISYDTDHKLLSADITKFYLRYAYYVVENYVKHHNGLIVLTQVLPQ